MSLIEHLQQISEFRAARGQRHQLWFILLLLILGAMMGYWDYRPLAESKVLLQQWQWGFAIVRYRYMNS